MRKIVQGALVCGLGFGAWFGMTATTTAHAASYSATRSQSVKLVWRKSMGQKTYTATTGARYSKHLGTKYGNNATTKSVVWVTDAHEKLYRPAKGTSAIYYHVKSSDGKLQGWIWRGYLTATQEHTATTKGQYSAARSNSVKLVWRKSMKQHAYTATTGARYSKHLGTKYGNNADTADVTWLTDAHEKLYRKAKGNSAIYYHVKSSDGKLQGWIWRGYLKAQTSDSTQDATTNTSSTTTDLKKNQSATSFTVQKSTNNDVLGQQDNAFTQLVTAQLVKDGFKVSQDLAGAYQGLAQIDDWDGALTTTAFADNFDPYDQVTGKLKAKDINFLYSSTAGRVGSSHDKLTANMDPWFPEDIQRLLGTKVDPDTGNVKTLVKDLALYLEQTLNKDKMKNFYLNAAVGYPASMGYTTYNTDTDLSVEFQLLYTKVADGKH